MKNTNTKTLTRVALLVAIEVVMKLVGLGSVPMGPLYMSFLTLPIAVGAITMGPAVGALLGGVFVGVGVGLIVRRVRRCELLRCHHRRICHDRRTVSGQPAEHLYPVRGYACAHGSVLRPDLQGPAEAG